MPAYWIARSKVNDPEVYSRYTDAVPGILEKYGGRVLARGGDYEIVEGPHYFNRFVVIEFESRAAAKRCFDSPEYVAAAANRRGGAGEVEITLVDGWEPAR